MSSFLRRFHGGGAHRALERTAGDTGDAGTVRRVQGHWVVGDATAGEEQSEQRCLRECFCCLLENLEPLGGVSIVFRLRIPIIPIQYQQITVPARSRNCLFTVHITLCSAATSNRSSLRVFETLQSQGVTCWRVLLVGFVLFGRSLSPKESTYQVRTAAMSDRSSTNFKRSQGSFARPSMYGAYADIDP